MKSQAFRKDIEPTLDKNLTETINQHEGENEELNNSIKLLETENKILKDDIATKQKLTDFSLQHDKLLITQQGRLTTELLTLTSENSCKGRNKDVIQTENNTREEQIHAKPRMSNVNKSLLKKNPYRVIKPIETTNHYSPLETEENPIDNVNIRTDSPNAKVTAKRNAINTATPNIQNSNDKTESDTTEKRKLPVTVILGDNMIMDIKRLKMSSRTRKVLVRHFS